MPFALISLVQSNCHLPSLWRASPCCTCPQEAAKEHDSCINNLHTSLKQDVDLTLTDDPVSMNGLPALLGIAGGAFQGFPHLRRISTARTPQLCGAACGILHSLLPVAPLMARTSSGGIARTARSTRDTERVELVSLRAAMLGLQSGCCLRPATCQCALTIAISLCPLTGPSPACRTTTLHLPPSICGWQFPSTTMAQSSAGTPLPRCAPQRPVTVWPGCAI